MQGGFHGDIRALPGAPALQPRRDNPGVVQHQDVAGPQLVRQVGDPQVLQRRPWRHQEQPRGIPRADGPQGDAVLGQVEVEIGKLHGRA
jgi:hypothetical protein